MVGVGMGDLTQFVEPLVRRGFRVVAFDAPGDGQSDHGPSGWRQITFLEFANALQAVVHATAPADGVVAHSGGVASPCLRCAMDCAHSERCSWPPWPNRKPTRGCSLAHSGSATGSSAA